MRLGGPIMAEHEHPEQWVTAVKEAGYRAAYCPLPLDAPADLIQRFSAAAAKADIVIAEVGAWSNPLSPDRSTRAAALATCKSALSMADRIGARCCVNIAGSRGEKWDGPCADDLTEETFDMIVETVREIIDSVQPTRTFYTLETMPWMYPDSADSYLRLIHAIDRPAFAAHFDPVNLVSSPQRYFCNAELISDSLAKLGPYIKSCHAKDIRLGEDLTVHLQEVRPGLGALDYRVLLTEIANLPQEVPIMLEHLPDASEYALAAAYIRSVAEQEGLTL